MLARLLPALLALGFQLALTIEVFARAAYPN